MPDVSDLARWTRYVPALEFYLYVKVVIDDGYVKKEFCTATL